VRDASNDRRHSSRRQISEHIQDLSKLKWHFENFLLLVLLRMFLQFKIILPEFAFRKTSDRFSIVEDLASGAWEPKKNIN
jgi:hypothetical protein